MCMCYPGLITHLCGAMLYASLISVTLYLIIAMLKLAIISEFGYFNM